MKSKKQCPVLFVEPREQGDYAVRRPNSKRASAVEPTQAKAERRARQIVAIASVLFIGVV